MIVVRWLVDSGPTLALNIALVEYVRRVMDSRYIFSALVGLFAAATIFAAAATVRHISHQPVATTSR
jgi:hypothetical protein